MSLPGTPLPGELTMNDSNKGLPPLPASYAGRQGYPLASPTMSGLSSESPRVPFVFPFRRPESQVSRPRTSSSTGRRSDADLFLGERSGSEPQTGAPNSMDEVRPRRTSKFGAKRSRRTLSSPAIGAGSSRSASPGSRRGFRSASPGRLESPSLRTGSLEHAETMSEHGCTGDEGSSTAGKLSRRCLTNQDTEEDIRFSVWRPPSKHRLRAAAQILVYGEKGEAVPFGDLFPPQDIPDMESGDGSVRRPLDSSQVDDMRMHERGQSDHKQASRRSAPRAPRTVAFFNRLFLCGLDQDYMLMSIAKLDPDMLVAHNVRVVILTPTGWSGLRAYREYFNCPFAMYSAPSELYQLMG